FDCKTSTEYQGQRGDDYQEQRTVTVNVDGKPTRKVQTVTKTRWSHASGVVHDIFDDILVVGSQNLDIKKLQQINTWDLGELKAYNEKYLSGFKTEVFKLKLEEGYERAKEKMQGQITSSIHRDIGGDRQRVSHAKSTYTDATFKEILLPIWLSSYRYRGKIYQILVNARTGKVTGTSPVSKVKVAIAIGLGILAIALLIFFTQG
ncbi:MAG: primosomal protein N' (replication factor Y) - superfamily II helicase, partial [Bacteroidota bacterium]